MSDWRKILQREHRAEAESFRMQLRCGSGWNKDTFRELFVAMRDCCKELDGCDELPRWIAELFWQLDWWVAADVAEVWGSVADAPDYYANATVNLNHLAWWLFVGEGRRDDEFEPMDDEGKD